MLLDITTKGPNSSVVVGADDRVVGRCTRPRRSAPRPMSFRSSKAFETLMVRMLGVIGVGTAGAMGVLIVMKSKGEFVPLELERRGFDRSRDSRSKGGSA